MKFNFNIDTEYKSKTNKPTTPLSVQISSAGYENKLYIHPKTPIDSNKLKHERFKTPFVIIDFLGCDWRYSEGKPKLKNYASCNLIMFFSYKDIEFLFADRNDYREYVLPELSRIRRISNSGKSIGLPYEIYIPDEKGKLRWHKLTISISDICAMQGTASLNEYASNVGIVMESKDNYTSEDKKDMILQYLENSAVFEDYAMGDVANCLLEKIMDNTIDKYNEIASLIGVQPRTNWGMSTGKIVANIVTEWLSNQIGIDSSNFYALTKIAGSKGISDLSKVVIKEKDLNYLAMVDGGRCVAERDPWIIREIQEGWVKDICEERKIKGYAKGVLIDIDISGCYGNGLKNQIYAVGNPTVIETPMTLKQWLKKYSKELIPGLWTARVSYKNAPFKQDVLISKVEKAFTHWDMAVYGNKEGFIIEDDRVYDASMVLTTESISHATLTHDLLQILKNNSSNKEWAWLLENMIVKTSAIYMKKYRKDKVSPAMMKGNRLSELCNVTVSGTKHWVGVSLETLVSKLIEERSKHPKKTPMNVFIKLIINTIYGCIASQYFSEIGNGVSNVVVGSNITARARALAWCMAKGLNTYMSITDGGVFNINQVNEFKQKSLNLLESLHRDNKQAANRTQFVRQVPLMRMVIDDELSIKQVMSKIDKNSDQTFVDLEAWKHLKKLFGDLDIFKYDQFKFESKNWYIGFTLHSKADYRLIDIEGKETIALRGMPKSWCDKKQKKIVNPVANDLFDAIEKNTPVREDVEDTKLLSQADWEKHPGKNELLPHDQVSDNKRFFSHTPLASRFKDMEEYKLLINWYDKAKKSGDALKVAEVSIDNLYEFPQEQSE